MNDQITWYHQIELPDGTLTPGAQPTNLILEYLDRAGLPKDASGLKVLDIGCADGAFSFELEKRGATVTAVDYRTKSQTGFGIAAKAFKSKVRHIHSSLYAVDDLLDGSFDIVLFLGVLYHLRYPLLGLDMMRRALKPGGLLLVESHVVDQPHGHNQPLFHFYPERELNDDYSNWFAPNVAGLEAIITAAEFEVRHIERVKGYSSRAVAGAIAINNEERALFRDIEFNNDVPNALMRLGGKKEE